MTPELGQFALALALSIAVVQSVVPMLSATRGNILWMQSARTSSVAQLIFIGIAFAALMRSVLVSDFNVANVVENSSSLKSLLFKITGPWGSHEGSWLLWVLILAAFGASVALFGSDIPDALKARTLSVQAWISTGFLSFLLLTHTGRPSDLPRACRQMTSAGKPSGRHRPNLIDK
jgi:cytochrome c-type biogenesis protein CcmF